MTRRRLLLGVFLACAASTVVGARQTASGGRMACDRVPSIEFPDVKIAEAVALPAADAGPIRVAHCRVTGTIGTEIRFSLLLPDALRLPAARAVQRQRQPGRCRQFCM